MVGLDYVINLIDKSFSGGMKKAKKNTEGLDQAVGKTNKHIGGLKGTSKQGFGAVIKWAKRAAIATGLVFAIGQVQAFGTEITNQAAKFEGYENAIRFASGADGAKNIHFLNKTIKSLNLDMASSFEGFQTLTGSLKGTSLEGKATRDIFDAVGVAATTMNLTADQSKGAFLAIGQMASKGKVQAEELRGQLGERIPGALGIAARSMGMSQIEFNKMLDSGKVYAEDFLPKFAKELKKTFEGGLPAAANSMQSAINKKNNAIMSFKLAFADVLRPALIGVLNVGTKFFNFLGELFDYLEPVKKAFKGVADVMQPITDNFKNLSFGFADTSKNMSMAETVMVNIAKAVEFVTPAIGFLSEVLGFVISHAMSIQQVFRDATMELFNSAEGSEFLANTTTTLLYVWDILKPAISGVTDVLKVAIAVVFDTVKGIMTAVNAVWEWGRRTEWVGKVFTGFKTIIKNTFLDIAGAAKTILGGVGDLIVGIFTLDIDKITAGLKGAFKGVTEVIDGKLPKINKDLEKPIIKKITIDKAVAKNENNIVKGTATENSNANALAGGNTNSKKQTLSGSASGGTASKNITFKIESLVKELKIQPQTLKEGMIDVEKQVKDIFIRMIRDVETQAQF